MRAWADAMNQARVVHRSDGPRRCPWPCKTAVKEDGDAELRIWPCEPYGKPRPWTPQDNVWRPMMTELAEHVAADIGCPVTVLWMGSDGDIERAVSPPGLKGRGFLCWGKGEREPKLPEVGSAPERKLNVGAMDLRILPQGEKEWH